MTPHITPQPDPTPASPPIASRAVCVDETILTRLRNETRELHVQAERLVGMPYTLDDLARTLVQFYGFLKPWEPAVSHALAPLAPRLAGRSKVASIESDLRHLGYTPEQIATLPTCDALPNVRTLPRALGSMYVFEGATLGGVIVTRHLEGTLGLSDGNGYSFYRSYGPKVGEMWRAFGAVVMDTSSPKTDDEIVAGASDTFAKLCDWFSRPV